MADNSISQKLYHFLCEKVGGEKEFKARRIFFKVLDLSSNKTSSNEESITSGSKAEGLDLHGSDIDKMFMYKTNVVRTESNYIKYSSKNDYELIMDSKYTQPGYVRIIVRFPLWNRASKFMHIGGFDIELFIIGKEYVLPNSQFKTALRSRLARIFQKTEEKMSDILECNGPCSSTKDGSIDQMVCFRLDKWPREALEWICRPRAYDWPSEEVISDIIQEEKSVLLVPIGKKYSEEGDNPHEWRMSFSVAELMLVHSFNHTQMLCYALLKILLKQVIEKEAKNLLCSYFMKTLLFWLIEETGISVWTPNNLFKCFKECLRRLLCHIKLGCLPNYFIRQNNMFESKIFGQSQVKLHDILHDIHNEGINFVLRTETLKYILSDTTNQICRGMPTKYHPEDKAIYPLLQYRQCNCYYLEKIWLYISSFRSNFIKKIFYMFFVQGCLAKTGFTYYDLNATNKRCYLQYKDVLPYLVIGTNINLNGWLPLAAFFYQHKQLCSALKVSNYVCSEVKNRLNNIIPFTTGENRYIVCKGVSFLQRYKALCISPLELRFVSGTVFDKCIFDKAQPDHRRQSRIYQSSEPIYAFLFDGSQCKHGQFIRFMCYHNLNDPVGKQQALCELQHSIDSVNITKDTSPYTIAALGFLFKAYDISNIQPPERNYVIYDKCIKLMLDHPLFKHAYF